MWVCATDVSPQRPDSLWGPPSLLFAGYWVPFPEIKQLGRQFDAQLHLVPRLRMSGVTPLLPLHFTWQYHCASSTTICTTLAVRSDGTQRAQNVTILSAVQTVDCTAVCGLSVARVWREAVAPSFKATSRHLSGVPKEKNRNLHQIIRLCIHNRTRTPTPILNSAANRTSYVS